jgi:hypothetical protein
VQLDKKFLVGDCRSLCGSVLYADDLIVAAATAQTLHTRFLKWERAVESKGLNINVGKTENMVCSKIDEPMAIQDCRGNTLKQVGIFKYLGSVINAKGGCEEDVRHRMKAG